MWEVSLCLHDTHIQDFHKNVGVMGINPRMTEYQAWTGPLGQGGGGGGCLLHKELEDQDTVHCDSSLIVITCFGHIPIMVLPYKHAC